MQKIRPFIIAISIIVFLLSLDSLQARQQEADSLKTMLQNYNQDDTIKANLLVDIANSIFRQNPEESMLYANQLEEMVYVWDLSSDQQLTQKYQTKALLLKGKNYLVLQQNQKADSVFVLAIEITQKNKDKYNETKTNFKIAKIWDSFSEYNKAIEYYNKAYALEEDLGNKSDMGVNLYQIGAAYDNMGDLYKATDYTQKAYDIFSQLGEEKKIALCLNNLGNFQNSLGNYTKALEYFQAALKINEQRRDSVEISNNLNNIGVVYMIMEDFIKAREYYQQSYDIVANRSDKNNMMYSLGNIGITYSYEEDYDKALEYFNQVLAISIELGNKPAIARTYSNIGRVYEDLEDYPKALNYYTIAYNKNDSIGNKYSLIYNLVGLGDVYRKIGETDKATPYLYRGLAISRELGATYAEKDALQVLTEMYAEIKRYDSAYLYLRKYSELKDTLMSEENIEEVTRKDMQYTFDKKILEEKLISELEINKQKTRKNMFFFIGLGILILAGGLWSRLRYIRKSRAIIQKEKDRSEELLLNILPAEVAEELKEKGHADAKQFDEVTVLFTDFKGFTQMAEKLTAQELVNEIDFCFKKFDEITSKYDIEKIKTIGDAYMCAGGLHVPKKASPFDMINAAFEIQQFMEELKEMKMRENKPFFELRLGIHTGPVVAGIVGIKKFQYDIWGDTVNIAARMESSGEIGKVNISQYTYEIVKDQFNCIHRGKIEAKGKGEIDMYFVKKNIS